jgi:site-specific recombinase XerD
LKLVAGTGQQSVDEELLDEMIRGYGLMMLAANREDASVAKAVQAIRNFATFADSGPWGWTAPDMDAWSADMKQRGLRASTLRVRQGYVRRFCEYLVNPSYDWLDRCTALFGKAPEQVCHEWNTTRHIEEYDSDPGRRALARSEVDLLLNAADDRVERLLAANHKGAVVAWRDATMLKVQYGTGVRPGELVKLQLPDLLRHAAAPQFERYALVRVRYGKRSKGGTYKTRGVQIVFDWVVEALKQYVELVRPALPDGPWLWPSERRDAKGKQQHVTTRSYELAFAARREESGLDAELVPHCLRHSWQTHMAEQGRDPLWRQRQAGHAFLSTTSIYTHASEEHMNREMAAAIKQLTSPETTA